MKVILNKDQEELLQSGHKIIDEEGNVWTYLPYWFKRGKGLAPEHELYLPDGLPEKIKEQLKNIREKQKL